MKKLVKTMAVLLMVAGVVGFMGCEQPAGGDAEQNTKPETNVIEPEAKPLQEGVLPAGSDGSFGTQGTYVKFGYWPQSKKADNISLGTKITNVNGWDCFAGTDGAYYIKVKAATRADKKYTFDDGTLIETGKEYYFKLEPIQWRVLTNDYKIPDGQGSYISSNKKLLFAEKALVTSCFYKNDTDRGEEPNIIYPNNYKESDIRTYLNNDFINKAFTPADIAKISETLVDNSWKTTFGSGEENDDYNYKDHDYDCENTNDKIFLLSAKEVTAEEYGFKPCSELDSSRIRKTTDYARAITDVSFEEFFLRSPRDNSAINVRVVNQEGKISGRSVKFNACVVPALAISF